MKIKWDSLLGEIAGLAFVVFLIKTFLTPELGWLEIIEVLMRGMVMWGW